MAERQALKTSVWLPWTHHSSFLEPEKKDSVFLSKALKNHPSKYLLVKINYVTIMFQTLKKILSVRSEVPVKIEDGGIF